MMTGALEGIGEWMTGKEPDLWINSCIILCLNSH